MNNALSFVAVSEADANALAAIRVEAMRESLENIGRFDPDRARNRFLSGFEAQYTKAILVSGRRVGFFVVRPIETGLYLDHLYVLPSCQSQGIGAAVLQQIFAEADDKQCEVRVGALRESRSNVFYQKHGFVLVEQEEFDNYYVRQPQPGVAGNAPPIGGTPELGR